MLFHYSQLETFLERFLLHFYIDLASSTKKRQSVRSPPVRSPPVRSPHDDETYLVRDVVCEFSSYLLDITLSPNLLNIV